jgi:multiple sugar transport system ATP-binding protein
MATIGLEQVTKVYGNGFPAVNGVDLTIADGEFMVLVGPSGCGKTTLLRMIAGLEQVTSGVVRIGERVVNDIGPKDRDIAMVFQSYALYPHMSAEQNAGFALKLQKLPKDRVRAKVREAAQVLGITQWLDHKPGQLSGGQRQRVAMGRAIVREPSAFLMDEPLSNLDAKLRVQMRAEVARIQRRLNVATVYVTHDQTEAMTMGDRVAVMRDGEILQCEDPQTIYDQPLDMFVAAFIGSPAMNLYEATLDVEAVALQLGSQRVPVPDQVRAARPGLRAYAGRKVIVGLRPEHLSASVTNGEVPGNGNGNGNGPVLEGNVELVVALGSEMLVHFSIDARRVLAEGAQEEEEAQLVERGECVARVDPRVRMEPGGRARFSLDIERAHFFDPDSGRSIAGAD